MEQRIPRTRVAGAVVSLAMSTAIVLSLTIVVNRLKDLCDMVDVPVPGLMLLLFRASGFIRSWWPVVVAALAVEGLILVWSLRWGSMWLRVRTWILIFVFPLLALPFALTLWGLLNGIGKQK